MTTRTIPMLPAKHFVFPVLRPLMTMIKCLKAMTRFEGEAVPVVLRRESLSNAGYLVEALTELCKRAEINDTEWKIIRTALRDPSIWKSGPTDLSAFGLLLTTIETFCKKHKAALSAAYRRDKAVFDTLYKKSVLKRKVRLIHGACDEPEALINTLSTGCYYEVDVVTAAEAREKSLNHHITILLCSDPNEASAFFTHGRKIGVELLLSDLGKKIPALNMDLCRIVNQAQSSGIKFINPPYVTMKILPALEDVYVSHLEAFDKIIAAQEDRLAREEDTLFKGMEEAQLYAELIVEAHWQKMAGFAMEQTIDAAV